MAYNRMAWLTGTLLPLVFLGMATPMKSAATANAGRPVLVELFTSEGCSSCPPADRLLQKLDVEGASGAAVVALSEHVDYWNHLGWKDPDSSSFFRDRQSAYRDRFGLASVYTPEMVVSGASEFVGSDARAAAKAIGEAEAAQQYTVNITSISVDGSGVLHAHLNAEPLANSERGVAEVYCAVALNHAESQVTHGENEGNRLTHVAVVQTLQKAGTVEAGKNFDQNVTVQLKPGADPASLRVIGFVQQPKAGHVLGAAMQRVK